MSGALPEYTEYAKRLRAEMDRLKVPPRGRNGDRRGLSEDTRIAPARVEEILRGATPTPPEEKAIARAIPTMKWCAGLLVEQRKADDARAREEAARRDRVEVREPVPPPPVVQRVDPIEPVCEAAAPLTPLALRPRTWGQFLRAAREAAGCSVADIASVLGVQTGAVNQWEADGTLPVRANYDALLELLPRLAESDVPKPTGVRDIAKPVGRTGTRPAAPAPSAIDAAAPVTATVAPDREPSIALAATGKPALSPLVAFGVALERARVLVQGDRATIAALLRAAGAAGLSHEDVAAAIEDV